MAVSYNKLWKLLIDKGITKTEMRKAAGISTGVLAKNGKNASGQGAKAEKSAADTRFP